MDAGGPSILASVRLQVDTANSSPVLCDILIGRSLDDVLGTALDVGSKKIVWANEECRITTGGHIHRTHSARLSSVEGAGMEIAQRLRLFFALADRIAMGEGLHCS